MTDIQEKRLAHINKQERKMRDIIAALRAEGLTKQADQIEKPFDVFIAALRAELGVTVN